MKTRYVDFLSDGEHRSLASSRADRCMFYTGVSCLFAMLAFSLAVILV